MNTTTRVKGRAQRARPRLRWIGLCVAGAVAACGGSGTARRASPASEPALRRGTTAVVPRRDIFPGAEWTTLDSLEVEGYERARFDTLRARVQAEGTSAMLVVAGGRVVFTYGEVARPTYLASARKSVVSILYGRYVADGTVRLVAITFPSARRLLCPYGAAPARPARAHRAG